MFIQISKHLNFKNYNFHRNSFKLLIRIAKFLIFHRIWFFLKEISCLNHWSCTTIQKPFSSFLKKNSFLTIPSNPKHAINLLHTTINLKIESNWIRRLEQVFSLKFEFYSAKSQFQPWSTKPPQRNPPPSAAPQAARSASSSSPKKRPRLAKSVEQNWKFAEKIEFCSENVDLGVFDMDMAWFWTWQEKWSAFWTVWTANWSQGVLIGLPLLVVL